MQVYISLWPPPNINPIHKYSLVITNINRESDISSGDESEYHDEAEVEEVWDLDQEEISTDFQHGSMSDHHGENDANRSLVNFLLIFTLLYMWSSFYGITYNAMEHFIQFLHYFFVQLSKIYPAVLSITKFFPKSLYLARKSIYR